MGDNAGLRVEASVRGSHSLGPYLRRLSYDEADRISALNHQLASDGSAQPGLDQTFEYDANSRLIRTRRGAQLWRYAYDANGNRSEHEAPNIGGLSTYTTPATSNRLSQVSLPPMDWRYDAQGGATAAGPLATQWQARYNPAGQISQLSWGPTIAQYHYDAERRRVLKDSSSQPGGGWTVFVYGLRGELLGEYDQRTGGTIREFVWLNETPVALLGQATGSTVPELFHIHADHLETPRLLTDRQGRLRWSWLTEPFGNEPANPQPTAGLPAVQQPLRMPGQYGDEESGLFYNHHRYYDPRVGRYVQSDPIGLAGGINTYSYVGGDPVSNVDPLGLWSTNAHNYFIDQFFPGLDPSMLHAVKAGSETADGMRYQDADHVFMHAMSSDKVNPAESRRKLCEYVKEKRGNFTRAAADPKLRWWAFFELGMALHPVMDASSPAHRGFQPWRYRNTLDHGPNKPGAPSKEDVDTAVEYRKKTLDLMRQAFNGTLNCDCLP